MITQRLKMDDGWWMPVLGYHSYVLFLGLLVLLYVMTKWPAASPVPTNEKVRIGAQCRIVIFQNINKWSFRSKLSNPMLSCCKTLVSYGFYKNQNCTCCTQHSVGNFEKIWNGGHLYSITFVNCSSWNVYDTSFYTVRNGNMYFNEPRGKKGRLLSSISESSF